MFMILRDEWRLEDERDSGIGFGSSLKWGHHSALLLSNERKGSRATPQGAELDYVARII